MEYAGGISIRIIQLTVHGASIGIKMRGWERHPLGRLPLASGTLHMLRNSPADRRIL